MAPKLAVVVLWLLVSAASVASAEQADAGDAYVRPGPYLGIGGSYAFENFSVDSDDMGLAGILGSGVDPKYDDSAGADVQVGYRLSEQFAVEFLYTFLEGFDSHNGTPETEIDLHHVSFNAKWFPFAASCRGRWQPYALAGIGTQIVNSEVRDRSVRKPFETDAGFLGRLGGGLDFYVTESFIIEAEVSYMLPAGGWVQDLQYTSTAFHFIYRF